MTVTETYERIKQHLEFTRDADLEGLPIRITHAEEKYDIAHSTLNQWANNGIIGVVNRAPKLLELNEADVKLASQIFHTAKKYTTPRKAAWVLKKALGIS